MAGNPKHEALVAKLKDSEAFLDEGKIHCLDCFEKSRGLQALSPTREQNLYNCSYCGEVKMYVRGG